MLEQMLKSVLEAANAELSPKPDLKIIAPGAEVAWDNACGQLWVRIVSINPRYVQSARGGTSSGKCPIGVDITLGVGVIRCISTFNDNGDPPSQTQITADGLETARDAAALYKALQCFEPVNSEKSMLQSWIGQGPMGGAGGGEWTYVVSMSNNYVQKAVI